MKMIKYTVLNDQLTDQQSSPALVYVKGLKFIIYPVKIVKNQIKKDKNIYIIVHDRVPYP